MTLLCSSARLRFGKFFGIFVVVVLFFFAFNLLVSAVRWWGRGRGITGSLQVAVGGSQSSLLQSVHRI